VGGHVGAALIAGGRGHRQGGEGEGDDDESIKQMKLSYWRRGAKELIDAIPGAMHTPSRISS
jgi:hypothetical protein